MSENLPDEIIADIVSRLPVKSVGQFRSVSKQWCSFLSDPKFIKAHLTFHSHKHEETKLILIAHVSLSLHTLTFNPNPQNGIDAISTKLNFQEKWQRVVGSCNGLVLVLNEEDVIFLINPTTLEYRRIPKSPLALPERGTSIAYALGYDVATDEYKVITLSYYEGVHEGDLFCTFVDVYSVRMGIWRRLESLSHHGTIPIHGFAVFLNGALHWLAGKYYSIVAFDPSDEKFFEVSILTTTLDDDDDYMHFYDFVALRGCLCMLASRRNSKEIDVWMMKEYGVAESWTKFSVKRNTCPYGFTPVCLMNDDDIVLDVPGKEKLNIYNKKEEQWREMNVDGISAKFTRTKTFIESFVSPMIIGKGTEDGDYIS